MESNRPPEALSHHTGFLMNWVAMRSRRRFAEALEKRFGLHPREFGALSVIAATPGITQQAISDAAGVDPSTMVSTLDVLEERGLAERRVDLADRRRRAVHLTAAGRRVVDEAQGMAAEIGKEIFGPLSADERTTLHGLLRKLSGLDAS